MIVRVLIWSLFDSKTTIQELRDTLPELEPPSAWLWNEASDRFGLVGVGGQGPGGGVRGPGRVGRGGAR